MEYSPFSHEMRDLQCDYCKNILEKPVTLPCGFSICAKHAHEFTGVQCSLCKLIHHGLFITNFKLSPLINLLNEFKTSHSRLHYTVDTFYDLMSRPFDTINNRFEQLITEVLAEKDLVIKNVIDQTEARANECLAQIEDLREKCLKSLGVNIVSSFLSDIEYVNEKIVTFDRELQSEKVSASDLQKIIETCEQLEEEVSL